MPSFVHRPATSLPVTTLSWLSLRDHFVATVGPRAGTGHPLGPLLVLADATFAPRSRFPIHPHREMEILSIVVDGTLSHHGDQANGTSLPPRSVQLVSARSGIVHAEGNDTDAPTRMLQLWLEPRQHGGAPAYFTRKLGDTGSEIVAGDDVVPLRADARVLWLALRPGVEERVTIAHGRAGYLLALTGPVTIGRAEERARLASGDGAELRPDEHVLSVDRACAALLVDVATSAEAR